MTDLRTDREGMNLVSITAVSPGGAEWLRNNVQSEGWQWLGNTLCLDFRAAEEVIMAALDDGLEVK